MELSEQERIRRKSLEEIRKSGIDPYPAAKFETNVTSEEILKNYDPELFRPKLVLTVDNILNIGLSSYSRDQLQEFDENGIILKRIKETEIIQETIETDQIIAMDELNVNLNEFILTNFDDTSQLYRRLISQSAFLFLKPNIFFNAEESNKLMIEEVQKLRPVLNIIKKGAIVIRYGEEINEENYPNPYWKPP